MSIKTTNPATNKVEKTFTEMIDEDVDKAIAQSDATFEEWKKLITKKGQRYCTK